MSTPIYQYDAFVFARQIPPGVLQLDMDASTDWLEQSMNHLTGQLTQRMMDYKGGRFEITSHSLTIQANILIVSFLARRIAGQQDMPG
jgi:hypothetical protein